MAAGRWWGGGGEILEPDFFHSHVGRGGNARDSVELALVSSCAPHFDPRFIAAATRRDATRRDAMRSIIEIDHAESGVADGEKIGRMRSRWCSSPRGGARTSASIPILRELIIILGVQHVADDVDYVRNLNRDYAASAPLADTPFSSPLESSHCFIFIDRFASRVSLDARRRSFSRRIRPTRLLGCFKIK